MLNIIPVISVLFFILYTFYKKDLVSLVIVLTFFGGIINVALYNIGIGSGRLVFRFTLFFLGLLFFSTKSDWLFFFNNVTKHIIFKTVVFLYLFILVRYYIFTEQDEATNEFIKNLTINVVIPFIAMLVSVNKKERLEEFIGKFILLGVAFFILNLFFSSNVSVDELEIGNRTSYNLSPIFVSRIAAILILYSVIYIPLNKGINKSFQILVLVFGTTIILLYAPQRGTILGIFFAISMMLYFRRKSRKAKTQVLIFIISLFIIHFSGLDKKVVEKRFEKLNNYKEMERYSDYIKVYNIIKTKPLTGLGVRGYSKQNIMHRSPHNFVSELTANHGIWGTIIALIIIINGFKISFKVLRYFNSPGLVIISISWLMLFTSIMVSGALSSNYEFLNFTTLLIIIDLQYFKKLQK